MAEARDKRVVLSHDPVDAADAAAALLGEKPGTYAYMDKLDDDQIADAALTDAANAAADRIKKAQPQWDRENG